MAEVSPYQYLNVNSLNFPIKSQRLGEKNVKKKKKTDCPTICFLQEIHFRSK